MQLTTPVVAVATAAMIALNTLPAHAHNWMLSPARSFRKAATTMPCLLRKASDTHQQVGYDQPFTVKFSTGHAGDTNSRCLAGINDVSDPLCVPIGKGYTSFVLIKAEDYHWLAHEDYVEYLEDYVVHAPESVHLDPRWSRYHGVDEENCGNCDGLGEDRGGVEGFKEYAKMSKPPAPPKGASYHKSGQWMFAFEEDDLGNDAYHHPVFTDAELAEREDGKQLYIQQVKPDSPNFLDHTFAPTAAMFRYTNRSMQWDRRSSYDSEKYPWIVSAGVYQHWATRPSDYDAVSIEIPRKLGDRVMEPGHYIVHYRWRGYSDCVDVNLHLEEKENKDGVDKDAYIWNKIEHCSYLNPKKINTACHIATGTPDQCVAELTNSRHESCTDGVCIARFGVNVVPLNNPAGVLFPERESIPWDNGTCANTEWTRFDGKVTTSEKATDWTAWDHERIDGQLCSGWMNSKTMSLKDAVIACASTKACNGISWLKESKQDDEMYEGKHVFNVCKPARNVRGKIYTYPLKASSSWVAFLKTDAAKMTALNPVTPPASDDEYVGVVFGPTEVRFGNSHKLGWLPANITYPDTGFWIHEAGEGIYTTSGTAVSRNVQFGSTSTPHPSPGQRVRPSWLQGGSGNDDLNVHMGFRCKFFYGLNVSEHPNSRYDQNYGMNTAHSGHINAGQKLFDSLKDGCSDRFNPAADCLANGYNASNPPHFSVDYKELYARDIGSSVCEDGRQNQWELAVDNGLYEVIVAVGYQRSSKSNWWHRGCAVENTRFVDTDADNWRTEWPIKVEVTDGKLSLAGFHSGESRNMVCDAINSLKIKRIGDAWNKLWFPVAKTTEGAWWQMELEEGSPVGLVSIAPKSADEPGKEVQSYVGFDRIGRNDYGRAGGFTCSKWWLYKGNTCPTSTHDFYDPHPPPVGVDRWNPVGRFDDGGVTTGGIVSVSDTSCSGETCLILPGDTKSHLCTSIYAGSTNPELAQNGTSFSTFEKPPWNMGQLEFGLRATQINCHGATGKYLRVWLPGPDRFFHALVSVNRVKPKTPVIKDKAKCAIKTLSINPAGSSWNNRLGDQKARPCAAGSRNVNPDGTCCVATAEGTSISSKKPAVCCADRSPFIPQCSAGKITNLMKTGLVHAATWGALRNVPELTPLQTMISSGGQFSMEQWLPLWDADTAESFRVPIGCDPECEVVIDFGSAYDVSDIKFLGGRWLDGTNVEATWPLNKHAVYAWTGEDASPRPNSDAINNMMMNQRNSSRWSQIGGSVEPSNNFHYTFASPVRTRYVRIAVFDNGGSANKRISIAQLNIFGCDALDAALSVPGLRGTSNTTGHNEVVDSLYPFTAHGWNPFNTWQTYSNGARNKVNIPAGGACSVWGVSHDLGITGIGGGVQCSSRYTFAEAEDFCTNAGGRLCTADEIAVEGCASHAGAYKGSACDVWTSSTCDKETSGLCSADPEDTVVCYGVEAQVHADSSTPEYIVSHDPSDPIFYSTCYVRERAIEFEPPHGSESSLAGEIESDDADTDGYVGDKTVYQSAVDLESARPEWKFNEECLSCDSFEKNRSPAIAATGAPPLWIMHNQDTCRACDAPTDLLLGACNASAVGSIADDEQTACFKTAHHVCPLTIVEASIGSKEECAAAIAVAYKSSSERESDTPSTDARPSVNVVAVDSPAVPAGCSVQTVNGLVTGYFNTHAAGSGDCAGSATSTALAGSANVPALKMSIDIEVVPEDYEVRITMRGPLSHGWFAFGLGANKMSDQPYTLVVEPGSKLKVSEWRLGTHSRGIHLGAEAFDEGMKQGRYWVEQGCPFEYGHLQKDPTLDGDGKRIFEPQGRWEYPQELAGDVQCCTDEMEGKCYRSTGAKGAACFSSSHFASQPQFSYQAAVDVCSAAGMRLCTKNETQYSASDSCCANNACWHNPKMMWTSDYLPPAPRNLAVVAVSTNAAEDTFEITVKRPIVGMTNLHYTFDKEGEELDIIAAQGDAQANDFYYGDCGPSTFQCAHRPQGRMSGSTVSIIKDGSLCVCKVEACRTTTTMTTATTTTTTATTTTTTKKLTATVPINDGTSGAVDDPGEELAAAKAMVAEAESKRNAALAALAAAQELLAELISDPNVDLALKADAEAAVTSAEASVAQAEAAYSSAQKELAAVTDGKGSDGVSKSSAGPAIGGAIAGVIVVALIAAVICREKKAGASYEHSESTDAFPNPVYDAGSTNAEMSI